MGQRGRRQRSRAEILEKRRQDDARRGTMTRVEPTRRSDLELPGPGTLLLNPFKSRARGGIILLKPHR